MLLVSAARFSEFYEVWNWRLLFRSRSNWPNVQKALWNCPYIRMISARKVNIPSVATNCDKWYWLDLAHRCTEEENKDSFGTFHRCGEPFCHLQFVTDSSKLLKHCNVSCVEFLAFIFPNLRNPTGDRFVWGDIFTYRLHIWWRIKTFEMSFGLWMPEKHEFLK